MDRGALFFRYPTVAILNGSSTIAEQAASLGGQAVDSRFRHYLRWRYGFVLILTLGLAVLI